VLSFIKEDELVELAIQMGNIYSPAGDDTIIAPITPVAADSVGVAIPKKIKPNTKNIIRVKGKAFINDTIFSLKLIFVTS